MNDPYPLPHRPTRRKLEWAWIGAFVGVNLLAPLVVGERFPFTIAPMFCQEPTCFCEYQVADADGNSIPLATLGLQRVYDGNPVGLGVGIQPPDTIDVFGQVPDEQTIRKHLLARQDQWPDTPYLTVRVTVVGDVDGQHVGPVEEFEFKLERQQAE